MQGTGRPEPIRLDRDFMRDPHAVYTLLRKEGPVREVVTPSGVPGRLVKSYDDTRALLGDPRLGKDYGRIGGLLPPSAVGVYSRPLAATMLASDPPDHTRLRKLVTRRSPDKRSPGCARSSSGPPKACSTRWSVRRPSTWSPRTRCRSRSRPSRTCSECR